MRPCRRFSLLLMWISVGALLFGCNAKIYVPNEVCNSSDTAPDTFELVAQTGVNLNTIVTSNAVTLGGFTDLLPAICVGCSAIVRNGVAGGTTAAFYPGDTLALQMRSANSSVTETTARITVGSVLSNEWSVTTTTDACDGSPAIGQVCNDGSVYAGTTPDGNVPMFTPRCDIGQTWNGATCIGAATLTRWSQGATIAIGATSNDAGKSNTAVMIAANGNADQPYASAVYCSSLNFGGRTDWYLPSANELDVLYVNRSQVGGLDLGGSFYWSSTEVSSSTVRAERLQDGFRPTGNKSDNNRVRCVRKN